MKAELKFNVLETMETIYLFSKGEKLNPTLMQVLEDELTRLSTYLAVTPMQSLLFANAMMVGFDKSSWYAVFQHFDLERYEVLKYEKDIAALYTRKYFFKGSNKYAERGDFTLNEPVLTAILQNEKIILPSDECKSFVDVLAQIDSLRDDKDAERIYHDEFDDYFRKLLDKHRNYPFLQWIEEQGLDLFEKFYVLESIWDCLQYHSNDYNSAVSSIVSDYYESKTQIIRVSQHLLSGKSKLTEMEFIELEPGGFKNYVSSKLTDKVINVLKEKEELVINTMAKKSSNLIYEDAIVKKELFYNPQEEASLKVIDKMLDQAEFKALQERLRNRKMPIGFCTLLYGLPGTGKTETVYQLAKASGRNIYKVDISETKSMWFGESQKLVKEVFTEYKKMVKTEEHCPILLFNEADGIIGKRKSVDASNVASTENAIQNILLEEMENFEGILFATTNLVDNIDAAFERRFLFKVNFEKSTIENAARIWRSKLDFISQKEALHLASTFDFSGGEVENIARKCLMEEVLLGKKLNLGELDAICRQEKWTAQHKSNGIGFTWESQ